jgi:carboxylesterase
MQDRSFTLRGGRTGFLLVHGLAGTPIELKFLAKGLAREGFTVHCCQLAGHCGSEDDLKATRWPDWYANVAAAFDRLRGQCDSVIVGGLSMGAVLALHLAAQRPREIDGLALYAPTFWYDGWAIPWYRFLLKLGIHTPFGRNYRFVERDPYGIKDPYIRSVIAGAIMSGDSAEAGLYATPSCAVRELWRLVDVVTPELSSIDVPALVVQAREDDISSIANAVHLQRRLGGLVDTLVLDDSYHMVTIDRQRDLVIERTVAFARWLESRRAREEKGAARVKAIGLATSE